jgi:hypothetical protein
MSLYFRPNAAGIVDVPALNASSELYIKGKKFEDYIDELVFEDNLDDEEIAEIQAFLARLDTSGLTGNLVITDANKNSVLKTAIDGILSKLTYLDTTALTQNWVITDSNRNATLKTAIDALVTKTNLLDTTALTQAWVITDSNRNATLKTAIDSQAGDISALQTKTQYITSSSNTITINTDTINIGQFNALTPSTQTNLRGDIYTNQAYFKSLNTSSIYGWSDFITLINSTNLPAYVASVVISSILDFMPSDVVRMAGSVSKSGDIQTTNDVRVQEFKMFNTSVVGVDILSKFLAFMLKGNATITTGLGDIALQTFSGHAFMRNNNISTTAIDWAVTEQRDKCNIVSIQNNDILIHLGAASAGGDIEVINSCGGDIVFKNGTNGLKSGTTSVMKIKYNNNFLDQIEMGLIDPALNWGTNNSKLFVSQLFNQTNGITVGSPDVFPATNHKFSHYNSTNANTGALILQDGYAGTTNKAIYTQDAGQKLFYSGQQVFPPLAQNVGGVGLTYLIRNPTNANAPQTLTMSEAYLSQPLRTITLSAYNANQNYLLATSIGSIPKVSNPVISGVMQHDQFLSYTANSGTGQIWDVVSFRATASQNAFYDHPTRTDISFNNVLRYNYPTQNTSDATGAFITGAWIPVCNNSASISFHTVTIPYVALSGTGTNTARLTIENAVGATLYTFPVDFPYTSGSATPPVLVFGGSLVTLNITNTTQIRFRVTNQAATNPSCIQAGVSGAQGQNGMMYVIHGDANQVYTTLLFDGVNNKTNLVNNVSDDYVLTLPITTMDITQLFEPNLQIETYFVQPSGTTSNHSVVLQYNDGFLSHVDSTFSTTTEIPTIQQVLTSGNNAGNLNILSLGTIEPSAITGWNVKEITAGTNISRTITSGSYQIANTAPVQDAQGGTGITVTKSNGVATISNTAVVQDTQAGSGISVAKAGGVATVTNTGIITATAGSNIGITVANNNLNITNTANVTDVIAGSGITVSIAGGTATVSQSLFQAIGNANDLSTTESTVKGQKAPGYYGQRWRHRTDIVNRATNDVIVSATGQYVYVGTTATSMYYSTDYGHTFLNSGYNNFIESKWISLAMSSTGKRVYMLGSINYGTTTNWRLHISNTFGSSWSVRADNLGMDDITTALPQNVCCSGDGSKILITDARSGSSGKVYFSGDSGTNFVTFNVASGVTLADDCCMSSNGQIQFITTNESTGGLTHAAIYRSSNFGNNWTKAFTKVSGDSDFGVIDCDTTGRIVVCCRKGGATNNAAVLSTDYGVSWVAMSITNARSVSITPNGFRIWFGCSDGRVSYSDNSGDTVSQYDIGSNLVYDRISTNADGTTIFTNNNTASLSINTAYSYMERFKIEELATQHYFCYNTNILQAQASGSFTPFPSDMDFINYEYYITFDFDKIYYDKDIYLGFNDLIDIPHQYDALYYASTITNNAESLRVRERNWVIQASDAGKFPIFYSPSAGSFFYCSASITYRFYAVSQKILIMERQGFTHYRTFNASVIDGKGFANTLADGVGIDYHTIRGRIDFINAKLYLDGNNAKWCPVNFKVFYNNSTNIGPASVRISNIERKAKNLITY